MKPELRGRGIGDLLRDYAEATRRAEEQELDADLRGRLASYRRFVQKQRLRIGDHPAALLPVAHAEPLDSPVQADARQQEAARKLGRPWLRRLNCPPSDINPSLLATIVVGDWVNGVSVFQW